MVVAEPPKREGPDTANVVDGVVVPTPTSPESRTVNNVDDAISATIKAVELVDPLPHTVNLAGAVDVPMARKFRPPVVSVARKLAESMVSDAE